MKCQRCNSDKVIDINGKTSDCFILSYGDREYDGYVPSDIGLGDDSDCIIMEYCLNCGQIQGKFPISDEAIEEIFEEDDSEE